MLTQGRCEIAGIRFLGCTLWTDYDLFGTETTAWRWQYVNAKSLTTFTSKPSTTPHFKPADALQIHQAQKQWLRDQLADPLLARLFVITHHAPSRLSLHPIYAMIFQALVLSQISVDLMGSATLHIHGHTHNSFDYVINGTRVIANQWLQTVGLNQF